MINRYRLDSIKWMDLLEFMMDLDIKYYLEGNNRRKPIYNRIRYLMGVKSGIIYNISHNYEKIKVDSYDSLP